MKREEVIVELKNLAKKLNRQTIRQKDIRSINPRLEYWINQYFDYPAEAIREAGLKPTRLAESMNAPEEELMRYLLDLDKKVKGPPTVKDIQRDGKYSWKVFKKLGGHKRAYEIARTRFSDRSQSQRKELPNFDNKGQFWGRASEFLVCAELLYRGYNANAHGVDLGMDITAIKDNKTFFIQVKNTPFHGNHAKAEITTSSFLRNQSGNVFYAFVLQDRDERNFLILPNYKIRELIDKKVITVESEEEEKGKKFRVNISKGDSIMINSNDGRLNENMSVFLNNWGIII